MDISSLIQYGHLETYLTDLLVTKIRNELVRSKQGQGFLYDLEKIKEVLTVLRHTIDGAEHMIDVLLDGLEPEPAGADTPAGPADASASGAPSERAIVELTTKAPDVMKPATSPSTRL